MFTNFGKQFWQQAIERAVKTSIQVFVALLSAGNFGLLDAPWSAAFSTAALAALLSVLTSVGSEPFGQRQSPSVVVAAAPNLPEVVDVREPRVRV